jgi:hypothetical protein
MCPKNPRETVLVQPVYDHNRDVVGYRWLCPLCRMYNDRGDDQGQFTICPTCQIDFWVYRQ